MYKEELEKRGIEQTSEFTLRVATYELGMVSKIQIYIERFGSAGFLGDLEHETADLFTQVCLFAEQNGYDLDNLREIGLERFKDRLDEISQSMGKVDRGGTDGKGS